MVLLSFHTVSYFARILFLDKRYFLLEDIKRSIEEECKGERSKAKYTQEDVGRRYGGKKMMSNVL